MKYGNSPPLVPAPTDEQQRARDEVRGRIRLVEDYLRERSRISRPRSNPGRPRLPRPSRSTGLRADEAAVSAQPSGGAGLAPGRVGQAFALDGNGYFNAPDAAAFDIDDRFTLSAWVYPESTPDGSVMTRMQDTPKGRGFGVMLDSGKVQVHLTSNYDDDAIRIETEETLSPKRWRHIVVTYTGSIMAEGVHIYLDGKPAKTKVLLDSLYRPFRNAGRRFTEPLRVGAGGGPEQALPRADRRCPHLWPRASGAGNRVIGTGRIDR